MYHLVMTFTDMAMERSTMLLRTVCTIYFYGPSIPWGTVSHNQMVKDDPLMRMTTRIRKPSNL